MAGRPPQEVPPLREMGEGAKQRQFTTLFYKNRTLQQQQTGLLVFSCLPPGGLEVRQIFTVAAAHTRTKVKTKRH